MGPIDDRALLEAYGLAPDADVDETRRALLRRAWQGGALLLAGAGAWTTVEALRPIPDPTAGAVLDVGAADAFAEGSATFVRAARAWVVRAHGELLALAQRCPHLGCRVPYCEATRRFECPCHGSMYDLGGEYLAGPAPRGMDRHPVQVVDGRALVDTRTLVEGPPIGAARHRDLVRPGPACGAPAEGTGGHA
jgi:nitrite reductase/ring-hydroxylating ferredoxin subunit